MPEDLLQYLPLGVVLLLVLRRAGRSQKVRTDRWWITPLLALLGVWSSMSREPVPGAVAIAVFVVAVLIGLGAGYFRALHMELSLDPATGEVSSKATPIGTILVVVFLLLRVGMDYALKGSLGSKPSHLVQTQNHGVDLFRLTDAALFFSTAMMLGQRFEILRRAHVLLAGRGTSSPAPDGQT